MLCSNCQSAPVEVIIKTGGTQEELCKKCAFTFLLKDLHKNQEKTPPPPTGLPEMMVKGGAPSGVIAVIPISMTPGGSIPQGVGIPKIKCPSCGSEFKEFVMKGIFSCPDCYEAFSGQIEEYLSQVFDFSGYKGKVPARAFKYIRMKKLVQKLKNQMEIEVFKENYEVAAKIRDTIKNLEEEVERQN